MKKSSSSKFHKAVSYLLIVTFSASSLIYGSPAAAASEVQIPALAEKIEIPETFGTALSRYIPSQNTVSTVIHIQDAHASMDSQRNIRNILNYLQKTYAVDTVFQEGAVDQLRPELLKFFKDEKLNARAAELFTKESLIGGTELFLLDQQTQKYPAAAYGIEDANLYGRNLRAFRQVHGYEKSAGDYLEALKAAILTQASQIFSKELQSFFREWAFAQDLQDETVLRHFDVLAKEAQSVLKMNLLDLPSQMDWPQMVRIMRLKDLEGKVEIKKAVSERKALQGWMRQAGLENENPSVENFSVLLSQSFEENRKIQDPRLTIENFYAEASPKGFSFKTYPELSKLLGQIILQSEIQASELFPEMDRLTHKLFDALAKTKEEKELISAYQDSLLLKKLLRLELVRGEYQKIKEDPARFRPSQFSARFYAASVKDFSRLDALYEKSLKFYEGAIARESFMLERLAQKMTEQKKQVSVLVTGGFHAEGMEALFKQKNIAYVSVMPRISDLNDSTGYMKLMTAAVPAKAESASVINLRLSEPLDSRVPYAPDLVPGLIEGLQIALNTALGKPSGNIPIEPAALDQHGLRAVNDPGKPLRFKLNPERTEAREDTGAHPKKDFNYYRALLAPLVDSPYVNAMTTRRYVVFEPGSARRWRKKGGGPRERESLQQGGDAAVPVTHVGILDQASARAGLGLVDTKEKLSSIHTDRDKYSEETRGKAFKYMLQVLRENRVAPEIRRFIEDPPRSKARLNAGDITVNGEPVRHSLSGQLSIDRVLSSLGLDPAQVTHVYISGGEHDIEVIKIPESGSFGTSTVDFSHRGLKIQIQRSENRVLVWMMDHWISLAAAAGIAGGFFYTVFKNRGPALQTSMLAEEITLRSQLTRQGISLQEVQWDMIPASVYAQIRELLEKHQSFTVQFTPYQSHEVPDPDYKPGPYDEGIPPSGADVNFNPRPPAPITVVDQQQVLTIIPGPIFVTWVHLAVRGSYQQIKSHDGSLETVEVDQDLGWVIQGSEEHHRLLAEVPERYPSRLDQNPWEPSYSVSIETINAQVLLPGEQPERAENRAWVMNGHDLTEAWNDLVTGNQIWIPSKDPRPGATFDHEIGYGLRLIDGEVDYRGFDNTANSEMPNRVMESQVETSDFWAQFNIFRSLRPGVKPLPLGRQPGLPIHPDKCAFGCKNPDQPASVLSRAPLLKMDLNSREWHAYHNVSPFSKKGHVIIIPNPHNPEEIRVQSILKRDLLDIIRLARTSQNLLLFYNSPFAGASVNHIHFQGVYRNPEIPFAMEKARRSQIFTAAGVRVSRLAEYPAQGYVFEGGSEADQADLVFRLIDHFQSQKPDLIPFNIHFLDQKIYIFPRNIDQAIVEELPGGAIASYELAGRLIVTNEDAYQNLNPEKIAAALRKTTLSPEKNEAIITVVFPNELRIRRAATWQEFDAAVIEFQRQARNGISYYEINGTPGNSLGTYSTDPQLAALLKNVLISVSYQIRGGDINFPFNISLELTRDKDRRNVLKINTRPEVRTPAQGIEVVRKSERAENRPEDLKSSGSIQIVPDLVGVNPEALDKTKTPDLVVVHLPEISIAQDGVERARALLGNFEFQENDLPVIAVSSGMNFIEDEKKFLVPYPVLSVHRVDSAQKAKELLLKAAALRGVSPQELAAWNIVLVKGVSALNDAELQGYYIQALEEVSAPKIDSPLVGTKKKAAVPKGVKPLRRNAMKVLPKWKQAKREGSVKNLRTEMRAPQVIQKLLAHDTVDQEQAQTILGRITRLNADLKPQLITLAGEGYPEWVREAAIQALRHFPIESFSEFQLRLQDILEHPQNSFPEIKPEVFSQVTVQSREFIFSLLRIKVNDSIRLFAAQALQYIGAPVLAAAVQNVEVTLERFVRSETNPSVKETLQRLLESIPSEEPSRRSDAEIAADQAALDKMLGPSSGDPSRPEARTLTSAVKAVFQDVAQKTFPIVWSREQVKEALGLLEAFDGNVTEASRGAILKMLRDSMSEEYAKNLFSSSPSREIHLVLPVSADSGISEEDLVLLSAVLKTEADTVHLLLQGDTAAGLADKAMSLNEALRIKAEQLKTPRLNRQIRVIAADSPEAVIRESRRLAGNRTLPGERGLAASDKKYLEAVGYVDAHRIWIPDEIHQITVEALLAAAYLRDAQEPTLGVQSLKAWMEQKGMNSQVLLENVQRAAAAMKTFTSAA